MKRLKGVGTPTDQLISFQISNLLKETLLGYEFCHQCVFCTEISEDFTDVPSECLYLDANVFFAEDDLDGYHTIDEGNLSRQEVQDFLDELKGLYSLTTYLRDYF